ncbi:MAG: hypothetical protein IPG51_20920 [Chloroflexi bacterium]|nr:hypothetical protein [Chloroflexota bacterium]
MNKWLILSISLLLLTACATPPNGGYVLTPNAAGTLSAADEARRQAANAATAQSAEMTRQSAQATQQVLIVTQTAVMIATGTAQSIAQAQTATSESIAVRASEQALAADATFSAIAANATGTAWPKSPSPSSTWLRMRPGDWRCSAKRKQRSWPTNSK